MAGLKVYFPDDMGITTNQTFLFADAHGNDLTGIGHLFAKDAIVKVILNLDERKAYIQNADTNAYIEGTFAKKADIVEAVSAHVENKNNPHEVQAHQIPVSSEVVDIFGETGDWSVDAVLRNLGNTLVATGEPVYRWKKSKTVTEYKVTTRVGLSFWVSSGRSLNKEFHFKYSDSFEIIDGTSNLVLVNPQEGSFNAVGSYSSSTGNVSDNCAEFNSKYKYFNAFWDESGETPGVENVAYSDLSYEFENDGPYVSNGKEYDYAHRWYCKKHYAQLVTYTDVVFSEDPNAYEDGYVDVDGWKYTAMDPVNAQSKIARIAFGSYVGTGTYGANNPCAVQLEFMPTLFMLVKYSSKSDLSTLADFSSYHPVMYCPALTTSFVAGAGPQATTTSATSYGKRTEDGKGVMWYSTNAANQYNTSKYTYFWVAFG